MGKTGLVFAGGGGKGAYQIGVWKALKEFGIDKQINVVAGTSVGGLNAALFAQGDYEIAEKIWTNISRHQILSYSSETIKDKLQNLEKYIKDEYKSYAASFFTRDGMREIIRENIDWNIIDHNDITCKVCCLKIMDNDESKEILRKLKSFWEIFLTTKILSRIGDALRMLYAHFDANYIGNIGVEYFDLSQYTKKEREDILLATSALPMIYSDVMIRGAYYVDGGLKDNLPLEAAIQEGCDKIYVVTHDRTSCIPSLACQGGKTISIIPIIANEYQGGFFDGLLDFDANHAKIRIQQGYEDAKIVLKEFEDLEKIFALDEQICKEKKQNIASIKEKIKKL